MRDYKVYIHTNKINGLKYVGITSQDVRVRWQSGYGYYKQKHFWNAINKYGWDNFKHEVIAEGLTLEQAANMEAHLIAEYKTNNRRFGYNRSVGGESGAKGVVKTTTQRKAASRNLKKQWENEDFREKHIERLKTVMQTDVIKAKRIASRRGYVISEETRRKMSENRKGKNTGPFTAEHINNMKLHHGGGADKRRVRCIDTGVIYDSINDAARASGINKKGISGCCRNVPHYNTAGGLKWEFC